MERVGVFVDEVHRFVARRVPNPTDAQDIAQQSLLQACQGFASFRGENLRAWLLTIARHLIVDHYRAQRRFEFLEADEAARTEKEMALQSRHDAVPELCANRERLRCYFNCIAQRLRLEQQIAILLADVHGYRDKEAAAALGVRLPTYKLLLHQARARLHECAWGRCALVQGASSPANGFQRPNGKDGRIANARQATPAALASGPVSSPEERDVNLCGSCPGRITQSAGDNPLRENGCVSTTDGHLASLGGGAIRCPNDRGHEPKACCAGTD